MPKYVFIYHGGRMPETPEAGKQHMDQWMAWMGSHKSAVVDAGVPMGKSHTVSSTGVAEDGGPDPASGISIFQADSHAAACNIAAGCPHLNLGGTIEVAEAMDMKMG